MSPPEEIRSALRRFRRRAVRRWGAQRAVMAVLVVTGVDGPSVLLTRRADASGQRLELPGGPINRWESAAGAARGQLAGTLGLHLSPESVLGVLDDYVTHYRHVITPVVLWAGPVAAQRVSGTDIVAVPFAELDVEPVLVASGDSDRPVIRLPLRGGWLHAPTAAVLHQFRELILHRRATRVAHLAPIPDSAGSAGQSERR